MGLPTVAGDGTCVHASTACLSTPNTALGLSCCRRAAAATSSCSSQASSGTASGSSSSSSGRCGGAEQSAVLGGPTGGHQRDHAWDAVLPVPRWVGQARKERGQAPALLLAAVSEMLLRMQDLSGGGRRSGSCSTSCSCSCCANSLAAGMQGTRSPGWCQGGQGSRSWTSRTRCR